MVEQASIVLLPEQVENAILQCRIVPAFQPVVRLADGGLVGFEVLARWQDEALGQVPPDAFIPVAQSAGMLGRLTCDLVEAACGAACAWPGRFYLAFNVPPSMLEDEAAIDALLASVVRTGFPLARIGVEMTEVESGQDEVAIRHTARRLQSQQVKVVLDDFGTGFSSLARLHKFHFEAIKIDGSFVRRIEHDIGSRRIVSAIVGLAHSLQAVVVAECVETAEQSAFLKRLGCDHAQGWLFGRPMPATQVVEWLEGATVAPRQLEPPPIPLHLRQHQTAALYEHAPVGLGFVGVDKRLLAANQKFYPMLGRSPWESVGQPLDAIYGAGTAESIDGRLDALLAGGPPLEIEWQRPDTQDTCLLFHHRVEDDDGSLLGLSAISIDITRRRRIEDALRASEAHFRDALGISPTVLWVADAEGTLTYISPLPEEPDLAFTERLGRWYAKMPPEDRERVHREWLAHLPSARPFTTRFRIRTPGAPEQWVRSHATPQIVDGRVTQWVGAFTNISREVMLEAELADARRAGAGAAAGKRRSRGRT